MSLRIFKLGLLSAFYAFAVAGYANETKHPIYQGRIRTQSENALMETASFLRAKDWNKTNQEEQAKLGKDFFDYSIAQHNVTVKLDLSGCKTKEGMASVSISFDNTMHRDGMGRSVVGWGLIDPDHYQATNRFTPFSEVRDIAHIKSTEALRKKYNISNPECVIGKTFAASLGELKIPCDGKAKTGRVWVTTDPKGKQITSANISNTYEIAWDAQTDGQAKNSHVSFKINVSPTLIQMRKYLVPQNESFINIPIKPKAGMGEAHNPFCGENVVSVPDIESLASYGIFGAAIAEVPRQVENSEGTLAPDAPTLGPH